MLLEISSFADLVCVLSSLASVLCFLSELLFGCSFLSFLQELSNNNFKLHFILSRAFYSFILGKEIMRCSSQKLTHLIRLFCTSLLGSEDLLLRSVSEVSPLAWLWLLERFFSAFVIALAVAPLDEGSFPARTKHKPEPQTFRFGDQSLYLLLTCHMVRLSFLLSADNRSTLLSMLQG